jgi:hypothetical protein
MLRTSVALHTQVLQEGSRPTPAEIPIPDASDYIEHVAIELQEATSPVAPTTRQQSGADTAPLAERPKRVAAAAKGTKQHTIPHRTRAANGATVNGMQQHTETAVSPAIDSAAATATASHRSAAAIEHSGRGDPAGPPQQQEPQPVPEVAWGVADSSPTADAQDLVLQRLLRPRSAASHAMPIRPQLQVLVSRLHGTAEGLPPLMVS